MKQRSFVVTLALVALLAGAVARAQGATCDDLEASIGAAKTAADHTAIAVCYDGLANAAIAKSEEHKAMGARYRKEGGYASSKLHFPEHCDYFTKVFAEQAKMYREMAAAHREMAQAKP